MRRYRAAVTRRRVKKRRRRFERAVERDDAGTVRQLLRSGFDPSLPGPDGFGPLYAAALAGAPAVARELLRAGADPDAATPGEDGTGGTPLGAAAAWNHTAVIRVLLAAGADPRSREGPAGHDRTPLEWAERQGFREAAELLRAGVPATTVTPPAGAGQAPAGGR
ncbi:ankyrin repeat domain-containing protein [Streptomyces alkaliphilus]|uniref:Ankyrin repeat domain-containing protein n=1 Tax=Streptomyces alkaliphilus TaxID=1472722 RepID=A0A7W3TFP6_9ACTN|nr:ankyrin repeat domain-containing protein [Streptomyces alkaliphilus]MBB0245976.1 ankyrin repeat domain-containing protein [Streptomyces alkaliphilus]